MLSAIIVGTVIVVGLMALWDKIRNWLLDEVATFLERKFGYAFSQRWKKTVVYVDRIVHGGKKVVRKVANVITGEKNSVENVHTIKVIKYDSEDEYTLEELDEMDKKGRLCQTFLMGES